RRFEDVNRAVAPLLSRPADVEPALLLMALAASRRGDAQAARRIAADLSARMATDPNPVTRANTQYRLAQIHAALGERDAAIALLRDVMLRGFIPSVDFHYGPGADSLYANPEFTRLVARD